jgi:hypothetical protein
MKKILMYCSYNYKYDVAAIRYSTQYINETNEFRLKAIDELINELNTEKQRIILVNNLNIS